MTLARTVLYRIVQSDPPTISDLTPNDRRGRSQRDLTPEETRLLSGISLYATEAQARRNAKKYPRLGRYIAVVSIPDEAPVRVERTRGPGHHTIWGDPEYLLNCVVQVAAVR